MSKSPTTDPLRYQPAEVRRRQIIDAASHLATSKGLDHTSIADVAKEAGLAKGSIYLHFESRDELIAALQSEVWEQMVDEPRKAISNESLTWSERLDVVVERWMRYEAENRDLYHAVFHEVTAHDMEPWDAARELLGGILAGGVESGEFDLAGIDEATTVEFMLHAYVGPCLHGEDILEAIRPVQELFRRTVGAGPKGA